MAKRPAFYIINNRITHKDVSFEWAAGFAISQKKKNVARLHSALNKPCLEVSTKSDVLLGIKLSAFNLKLNGYTLENVFQSAKVFKKGGPYIDLLNVSPRDAKRDLRLKGSGELKSFYFENHEWDLTPKTAFYDYIYCKAVKQCIKFDELKEIMKYEYFTDIEFNPAKSINTQARAIVIVKKLIDEYGEIPDMTPEEFVEFHKGFVM